MKITFLGTRGFIDVRTRRHYRHASTMISYKNKRVMIDCGLDWQKKVWDIKPDAIIITHAHPDHCWGLKKGSPCPVYATKESWELMKKFPIPDAQRFLVLPRKKIKINGITFETFPVIHSIIAPGVGYRITAGKKAIFCVHDLIYIHDRAAALKDIKLYIGDGATIKRPMVRRRDDQLFGHTTIKGQLVWCKKEHVPEMIITHCGSQIVGHDGRKIRKIINTMSKEYGVPATIAYDGMERII
jgi:phosphoribosyl 1,2-cyclic phosphodiesterase